jgi:cytoplasmic iron level regulating protein YaaA (DUF328/UPF0246 family)
MLILLSPAKSLDFETPAPTKKTGLPSFLDEQTTRLSRVLRKKKASDLAELMGLSKGLAQLNYARYQQFDPALIQRQMGKAMPRGGSPPPAKQALWAFTGDVYQGLDVASMKARQIERAQARIRMLSGLYGVLKPFDLILPYRLEMGTKLKTRKGKNLYEFWGSAITEALAAERPDWICNLASAEYYKSVKEKELSCPVVHPVFKDESKGEYRVMGLFAKYARGLMARWIIDNNAKKPEQLAGFDAGGYRFSKTESTELGPVFKRPATARL